MSERSEADLVEALANGFLAEQEARSIAELHPGVSDVIVSWIREAAREGDWVRVGKFANLAAPLRVEGLGEVLQEILDSAAAGVNEEDLVDILSEIREADAVDCLFRVAEGSGDYKATRSAGALGGVVRCHTGFTGGDIWACGGLVAGLVPFG
jgi:hypothetical protein